jgi:hypothetical protein
MAAIMFIGVPIMILLETGNIYSELFGYFYFIGIPIIGAGILGYFLRKIDRANTKDDLY